MLELFTAAGGLIGSLVAASVSERTLMITFSVVMASMSLLTFLRRDFRNVLPASADPGPWGGRFVDEPTGQVVTYRVRRMPLASITSLLAGVLSTLLGLGGGVVKVPILNGWCGVPMRVASTTSGFMIGVTATSGRPGLPRSGTAAAGPGGGRRARRAPRLEPRPAVRPAAPAPPQDPAVDRAAAGLGPDAAASAMIERVFPVSGHLSTALMAYGRGGVVAAPRVVVGGRRRVPRAGRADAHPVTRVIVALCRLPASRRSARRRCSRSASSW